MISTSKPRYRCRLVGWYMPNKINHPDVFSAVVMRFDTHVRLGPPKEGKTTVTSQVVRIDVQSKMIETLNSVYCYGGEYAHHD